MQQRETRQIFLRSQRPVVGAEPWRAHGHQCLFEQGQAIGRCGRLRQIENVGVTVAGRLDHFGGHGFDCQGYVRVMPVEIAQFGQQPAHRQ
ncbi:hypothetical protein D9M71_199030 [compost metagenome]